MPTAGRRRIFIGLRPPAEVARELHARCAEALSDRRLRAIDAGELHATLVFLGDVDGGILPSVTEALTREIASSRSIEARLAGFGAFPSARDARVVWAGVEEGDRAGAESGLHALYARVHACLADLRLAREPVESTLAWKPHVTLARLKRAGREPFDATDVVAELARASAPLAWTIDSVCVFESDLQRERGERYPVLARLPLSS